MSGHRVAALVEPPAAVADRVTSRMSDADALLWDIERDPTLRTTIVAVAVLDRAPDWPRLRARLLDATAAIPRMRQRVVPAPWRLTNPSWVTDDRFDLDYHLRRAVVPAPGDLEAVLAMAAPAAMAPFDKERPLWEFTLVEGLAGGAAALVEKVHHSVTDGVGGMAIARAIVDDTRGPRRRQARRREGSPPAGGARPAPSIPHLSPAMLRDPLQVATGAYRGVRSLGRILQPAGSPLSPVMRGRGPSRRLVAFDVPLGGLLAAGHAVRGTLNDAFLAAIADGMRSYHAAYGATVDSLRVTMPVNLRRPGDAEGSNHFAPVRFALPITDDGPAAQMRRLGELSRRWQREPALPFSDMIAGALNRLPVEATTALFGSMLKGVDLVATNVPGLSERAYLAGAEVVAHYAFPPPSGAACGIALLSHGARACIGVTIDPAAIPDPAVLRDCLHDGFGTVLAVGRDEAWTA